ncbi:HPr family phosphocarrier protein [Ferviditalea candida]|uniref:Phosphocarrier protein HPr n=1 Tax=Ferviditalea candida TaxID=3108399 RepID=A0ABU5ZHL7_9BACL|nr:HPr family phosphocarrier protein [Paenibacillaceae bacterium T2]
MITQTTAIRNEQGFHLRPAQMFTELANKFESEITLTVSSEDDKINPKSILNLMSLGIGKGTAVTISAEGPDEAQAVAELIAMIESGFGE